MQDLAEFKAAMRVAREGTIGGRAKLEASTGIDQSTIYRIETDATYDPSISTVITLIHGMGLTLSGFFAEIEAEAITTLQSEGGALHNLSDVVSSVSNGQPNNSGRSPLPSESRDVVAVPTLRSVDDARPDLPNNLYRALGFALIEVGTRFAAAGTEAAPARPGVETPTRRPPVSTARPQKPSGGNRRAGNRR